MLRPQLLRTPTRNTDTSVPECGVDEVSWGSFTDEIHDSVIEYVHAPIKIKEK